MRRKLRTILAAAVMAVCMSATAFAATEIGLNLDWKYAGNSKINTGKAVLYTSDAETPNGITVAVNAGHGTKGGESVKTLCHPDGSAKLTGGTTQAGAVEAVAVSSGMTFADGTPEKEVTLEMAHVFARKLLADGYNVLMLRPDEDVQLDNVARTVIANNKADCHIALHWDSTAKDKGVFFMTTPQELQEMEPVSANWEKHHRLGSSLVEGLEGQGAKVFGDGTMDMDLTQTAYSTIPSVDIELGDKKSDHSGAELERLADGLLDGVNRYYGFD